MKKLREYCFYSPIAVLIFSIIFSVLLMVIVGILDDFLPNWLRPKAGLIFYAMLLENGMMSVLSGTVVLNVFKSVRNKIWLSFITFFLAGYPLLYSSILKSKSP